MQGIGTDIIEIDRVQKACMKKSFYDRVFTLNEQLLFETKKHGKYQSAAANFAAKEAVAKAFGTGFSFISFHDIEILRNEKGSPYVVLHNNAKTLFDHMGCVKILISLSHSKAFAVATAFLE